ncbi:DNA-directed DNA/RNA polymerase mu isoform X2 [Carettochelys insculpta]|uniref:DNA-directed DNA/RNA polymerase mu isoform X2 n=1 Tax=Carettochelys insculpta TaxID=44489 RepID=UPI003EB73E6A
MALVPLKRRSRRGGAQAGALSPPAGPPDSGPFPALVLYLVEKRMGASRRAFLTQLARAKGFRVDGAYSAAVTHVVAEQNSGAEVAQWLKQHQVDPGAGGDPALLDISWFTESMRAGQPVEIQPRHRLVVTAPAAQRGRQMAPYACERCTPLLHPNRALTEALETLAEEAWLSGSEGRSLAFTRAAAALKALPGQLETMGELESLPGFGDHCRGVIQLFTKVFGVGVKTADRWYQEGLRTLADLHNTRLTRQQQAGLQHYEDLTTPVGRGEAEAISREVQAVVQQFLPGASVTLAGGFRRGKPHGHDVDLLLTHPEDGQEAGLLSRVVSWLDSQGLILYQHSQENSYGPREGAKPPSASGHLDRYERCFSIFRLAAPGTHRGWKAVRVDLVVAPASQFPFALLGWTGSRHFERELRRFARHERKMTLNSHELYDTRQNLSLPAASEEEIFQHLGLEYVPPEQRNA